MSENGIEIDVASYGEGYKDGQKSITDYNIVLNVGFFILALTLLVSIGFMYGAWRIDKGTADGYAQGQKDAYNGTQHFYPVKQETVRFTEWHDDREDVKP